MNPAEDHIRHVRHELRTNGGSPSPVGFAPPAVIALDDVWLAFDHPVLQGVTLAVYEGETLVVFGESGSGKSTILKLILRLLVPDRGSIHVFGRDIVRMSYEEAAKIRRRIGMVFQYAALFDSLTVYENVAYPLREHGHRSEAEIEHTVREKLEFVDLDPDQVMTQLPGELSGGMRKRVGIARAIAADPEIVLYDEPTAGLDPVTSQRIFELLRDEQRASGATVIMVSSDLDRLLTVTDRVGMLYKGRLIFDGTTEEAKASHEPRVRQFVHGLTEGPL